MKNFRKGLLVGFFFLIIDYGYAESQKQIIEYGPGIHEVDEIILDKPNMLLKGMGRGVTVLKVKRGIKAMAPYPIIKDLTVVGEGKHIGIQLANTWSAIVADVRIENYAVGLVVEINEEARKAAPDGKTQNGWPSHLVSAKHLGSRSTLTDIRNLEIIGEGNGFEFYNRLKTSNPINYWKSTNEKRPGEFINAINVWGGHIAVKGRAVLMGDGVRGLRMFGTYIDIYPGGGIEMQYGSMWLQLIGVTMDLNSKAREQKTYRLRVPERAKDTVLLQATGPSPQEISIEYY